MQAITEAPITHKQGIGKLWLLLWFALLIAISYANVLRRLFEQWVTNDDMSHGMFVPILVGFIVWQRREQLLKISAQPSLWGIPLLLFGALMLCIGPPSLPTFAFMTRMALLFTVVGAILALCGQQTLKALSYPLLLSVLMIPIPGFLYERVTLPLQFIASASAEHILEFIGFSVLREGNILHIPNQTLSVVEACSGLRSLLSLSFLGQAYIYLFDDKAWMRWVVALIIFPIAIFANALRIVASAIMGQYNKDLLHGVFHDSTAWVVFVVAFFCLLIVHQGMDRLYRRMAHA